MSISVSTINNQERMEALSFISYFYRQLNIAIFVLDKR